MLQCDDDGSTVRRPNDLRISRTDRAGCQPSRNQILKMPSKGSLTLGATGAFVYTPTANATGSDSFTYKVSDGLLDSNVATVAVTIEQAANGNAIYVPMARSSK